MSTKLGQPQCAPEVNQRADLFLLDELGYLPLEPADATFLFEVVGKRYEAGKATIVTSNQSFGQWDQILPDPVLATALLRSTAPPRTTIDIRGESYRLRHRRAAGLTPS